MKKNIILLVGLLTPIMAFASTGLKPINYVSDFADIISPEEEAVINHDLAAYEQISDIEIAVVTVNSLNDDYIESFANDLFSEWGIGKEGVDNGLLILVAPNERQWRIEVGYGLEPYMTDALSYRLSATYFTENFRSNKYGVGIYSFVTATINELESIPWEEREALHQRYLAEKEARNREILNGFMFFLFGLLGLALVIALIVTIIQRNKKLAEFKAEKEKITDNYTKSVDYINEELRLFGIDTISVNVDALAKIKNAKTIDVANDIAKKAELDLAKWKSLITRIYVFENQFTKLNDTYQKLTRRERDQKLSVTKKHNISSDVTYGIENIETLENLIQKISSKQTVYEKRIWKICEYTTLISIETTDSDIDDMINQYIEEFSDRPFPLDAKEMEKHRKDIKYAWNEFNLVPKSFTQLIDLRNKYDDFERAKGRLSDYIKNELERNQTYLQRISKLQDSASLFASYVETLEKYKNDSDINRLTKKIMSAIKVIKDFGNLPNIKFKSTNITDNDIKIVTERYDFYEQICKTFNETERHAKKEIEEAEEERAKKRREEENRRRCSRSSSYGYGSSFGGGMSGGGGGFGGFGGGMSGGGGATGRW